VLPDDLPAVPGLVLAARSAPVGEDDVSRVGGDWYDAFTVANGDLTIVVGDVSGHDLAAALVMGQVRNGLRTLFVEYDDPARALGVLDRQLAHVEDGPIATAVCIRYRDGDLVWTSAGHPPLLVLRHDGTAEYLVGPPGPVLGVGGGDYEPQSARLEPGDVLIAFTDGVVEHRDWSLDEGFEHLRRLAEAAPSRDPNELCEHLLADGLRGRTRSDDACVLVVARSR
jgi:serine phosphatase RsbU (regulator of sigma subunit)